MGGVAGRPNPGHSRRGGDHLARPVRAHFQMNRATPQMRGFAKHLMVYEAAKNKSSEARNPAAFHVTDKLRPHMATLMGIGGFRALLSRALVLANGEVSWLHAMRGMRTQPWEGWRQFKGNSAPPSFSKAELFCWLMFWGCWWLLSARN